MGLSQKASAPIEEIQIKIENNPTKELIRQDEPVPFSTCIETQHRDKLSYLYEDNRINQIIGRSRPQKDVIANQRLLRNRTYFKDLFEDEIRFNLQRAGVFDSENIEDSAFCN